jgi:hypothetical protein
VLLLLWLKLRMLHLVLVVVRELGMLLQLLLIVVLQLGRADPLLLLVGERMRGLRVVRVLLAAGVQCRRAGQIDGLVRGGIVLSGRCGACATGGTAGSESRLVI